MLAIRISQNVTPGGNPKFNRMEDQGGSSTISISGGPITGNNYLLDGISDNELRTTKLSLFLLSRRFKR